MAEKHPVTALQELAISRELTPLVYYFEEIEGPKFKCTVQVGGKTCEAVAATKRLAKRECAQIALEELQIVEKPQKPTNYIGDLNVYASKNHVNYPVYECFATTKTGEFIVNCSFLGCQALGKGHSQKEAKQNAAKNMLELYVSQGKCEFDTQRDDEAVEKINVVEEIENNSEKSEVIGWGAQDLEEVLTRIKTLGLHKGQVFQKDESEEDNKNTLEENSDVSKKKNKTKKKKSKKSEANDFGIQDLVTGVNSLYPNTGEQKEEGGVVSKAKKEESNKSEINGLGVQDLAKILAGNNTFGLYTRENIQKQGNEEDNVSIVEEESGDVSSGDEDISGTKAKVENEEIDNNPEKNEVIGWGAQDLEEVLTRIKSLGLHKGQVFQKNNEEESSDVSKKKKTKKKKSKKSEANFYDLGIQDLVTGVNSLYSITGEQKEESGIVSKAKKEESNKSEINTLKVQDLAKIFAGNNTFSLNTRESVQKEGNEEDNMNIVDEESEDVSSGDEDIGIKAKVENEEIDNITEKSGGPQNLEEILAKIKTLGLHQGQVFQKNDNEDDNKNTLEEESGDVIKKKNKAKKKKKKKSEVNFHDFGIQDLVTGVNSLYPNTGEQKEESGIVSKAKKEESNKSEINGLGVQNLANILAGSNFFGLNTRENVQKEGNEEDNKNTLEEESSDVSKKKTKKKKSTKSEVNLHNFAIQDLVTGVNSLYPNTGEHKEESGVVSKAKKEESNKREINSLGVHDLAKILAGNNSFVLNTRKNVQKEDNEEDNMNIVEENNGDVTKAKKKATKSKEAESKKHVVDGFGIQNLEKIVAGKKSYEEVEKTVKKKSGNVVQAKKKAAKNKTKDDESKKGEVNDLGVQDLEKIFPGISTLVNIGGIRKKCDEEGKKKTVKEESDEVSKAKTKAAKAKTKKEEIKKSDVNSLGVQDLQKIVAGINTLGENSSKASQIHIVINLPQ